MNDKDTMNTAGATNEAGAATQWRLSAETAAAGIGAIPSLPAAVVELMAAIDRDDVDTDAIAARIARDQGLTARVLRVANSPFYGQTSRVATIADAVMVLGLRAVRTMATAAAVTGVIRVDPTSGFDIRMFWRHSVGAALCARALAARRRLAADEAFTAGLLHDIGRAALAICFPAHSAEIARLQKQLDCHTLDAERAVTGIDHAHIGELLAARWRFPPALCAAIGGHHAPPENEPSGFAALLHVADALAHALDLDGDAEAQMPRLAPACWSAFALSWDETRDIFTDVDTQFDALCESFVG